MLILGHGAAVLLSALVGKMTVIALCLIRRCQRCASSHHHHHHHHHQLNNSSGVARLQSRLGEVWIFAENHTVFAENKKSTEFIKSHGVT